MNKLDRKQKKQGDDWQYVDAGIIRRILAAQNFLFDFPGEDRMAEYFSEVLLKVPGVDSCFICLGNNSTHGEDANELCCKCGNFQKNEAGIPVLTENFSCGFAEKPNMRTIQVGTSERIFGFFFIRLESVNTFEPYYPYLHNLTNFIAISLETRILKLHLEESHRQLEMVNKEMEAFAYSVSHDLRAPLRSIDGFSLALLDDYKEGFDEKGIHYLNRVRTASQRMSQLIDDMLSLSRVSRGEMMIQTVNLSEMFRQNVNDLQEAQPERKVRFVITNGLIAQGDVRLLRIVLGNLTANAWKFTSKHSEACIEFGIKQTNGSPVYFVRDDGAGFDMSYSHNLFSAFRRLHTVDEFPGTGTGLAIVQRIIHRHGGKIWAEGEVEKGATFYFTLK